MRHLAILLTVGLLAALGGAARAAGDGEHKHVHKVKVMTTDHKEHRFNLQDPDHKAEFDRLVREGAIAGMQEDVEKNLLEIRWDLGAWTVVVFFLLFFILRKAAWGPMLEGLQKREENIQAALVEAKEARSEAKRLKDELAAERDKAAAQVAEMIAEARRDTDAMRNEMLSKAKAEIQVERDRLLREFSTAKDQALQELFQKAADLATMISSKAVKRNLNVDDHRRLVDEAIADMSNAHQELKRLRGM